ncbi:MAG: ribonuclease Z [Ruminococcus sp.]|nr:ribonuclease Z [Ruminococcus sp.]
MIDITFIGTGALMPIPDRALISIFLRHMGKSILFDCGEGTQSAAKKAGVNLQGVDLIALTHYHGDHILGLPGLLQSLSCFGREEPLYITGPEGLKERLAPILALCTDILFEVRLIEIPEEGLDLSLLGFDPGAHLSAFPVNHSVVCQGYVFTLKRKGKFLKEKADALNIPPALRGMLHRGESVELNGRTIEPSDVMTPERKGLKVVYSGDTTRCDSLTRNAADADLFICEATFAEDEHTEKALERGHMTYRLAAQTAKKANVKHLCLAHFSPRVTDPSEFITNATEEFENAFLAEDGMNFTLYFENTE